MKMVTAAFDFQILESHISLSFLRKQEEAM